MFLRQKKSMRILPLALITMFLFAAALFGQQSPITSAATSSGIELKTEAGIQGVIKDGKWMRVRVTLTNHLKPNLKGELSFTLLQPNGGTNLSYIYPVELPINTPIIVDMTVPGMAYDKNNNFIQFHEGKSSSGDLIPFLTSKPYLEANSSMNTIMGVLARDPDTFNFMPILNQKGYNIQVVSFSEDQLPEQSMQLDALDYLLINDVATGGWSETRRQAVLTWVQRGGTLILSGGAGYSKTAEAFGNLVPMKPEGTTELHSLESLNQIGEGKPLDLSAPVTLSTGTLQENTAVTLVENRMALAAQRDYGKGQIVYAAFDPSLEPLASWSGSPALWARILSSSLMVTMPGMGQPIGYNNTNWQINNLLNYFPSIAPPSLSLLIILFAVYILLVAPALYLLLKKFDRREWAWWIIPLVSLVSSAVIFTVGASDKSTTLAHSLRIVELSGEGDSVRSASAAVFVPRGGTVKATFEPNVTLLPYPDDSNYGGTGNLGTNPNNQFVRTEQEGMTAIWNDVPYWSVRKTWLQVEASNEQGRFDISTSLSSGNLNVQVTNQTGADLRDLNVLFNGSVFPLQDMKKGEASQLVIPMNYTNRNGNYFDYGHQVFPQTSNNQDKFTRERGLINAYMNDNQGKTIRNNPVVVGFSSDNEAWFSVNGKKPKSDNLTLWMQDLKLNVSDKSTILLLPGSLTPTITRNSLKSYMYDHNSGQVQGSNGEMEFEYVLPWTENASYDELTIYNNGFVQNGQTKLSIWNEAQQRFDPLVDAATLTPPDPAASYITVTSTIRMKIETTAQISFQMPSIGLNGKVKP